MVSPVDELMQRKGLAPSGELPRAEAGGSLPTASVEPASVAPQAEPELPVITNPTDVIEHFYRANGRAPMEAEVRAIRALPIISRQLGRRPSKAELLAFLDGRNETPKPIQPEFEVSL